VNGRGKSSFICLILKKGDLRGKVTVSSTGRSAHGEEGKEIEVLGEKGGLRTHPSKEVCWGRVMGT